jgi:hypothetical protein
LALNILPNSNRPLESIDELTASIDQLKSLADYYRHQEDYNKAKIS